ncbi:MAG: bifunctional oligoribonuclease/PAP phosphatase NrnA [Candidatus Kapabacteria bacterium]|nr:bifunctional oligoribonuclease/PAP phosphatase NrnA [Candidatus Kapabacteria bacterium]
MRRYPVHMNNDHQSIQSSIAGVISEARTVVITTHVNPDGDAIGSALGLWHWICSKGAEAQVVLPNAAPENLRWLPGASSMITYGPAGIEWLERADVVVVLDLNTLLRLGELGERIAASSARIVNIDHHTHPQAFAEIALIDTDACSTCSMIAELIIASDGPEALTPNMSMCLYTGIMTDTGSFRFPRTNANVFRLVAALLERGADPVKCYDEVMNQSSFGRTRLLGAALASLQLHASGSVCTMTVRRSDLIDTKCSVDDVEGFVHHTLSIAGVMLGILFVEVDGEAKCSFRSKGDTFVRDLAATWGGGGHVYAAGARIRHRPFQEVVDEVTAAAISIIPIE